MILRFSKPIFYLFFIILSLLSAGFAFIVKFANHSFLITAFIIIGCSLVITGIIVASFIFLFPNFSNLFLDFRRLNRFESLTHPLLVRLAQEAPGTYQHSLNVSTLAYRAAKSIGANAILARIGAYYHDIGKIQKPEFYIENQKNGQNPHDELTPKESAEIVINHILYGESLAREYRLPEEIRNFIREHQGTGLVSYFYNLAKEQGGAEEADFRYPGPKPQSKETALVLLADTLEAKTRLLRETDEESLTKLIEETIKEKKEDSQLSESTLSERELEKIKKAFLNALLSVHHKRIDYRPEEKRGSRNEFKDFGI